MAVMVDRMISTLNPDAPVFDPVAFREVEDFSRKWWELVRTSKWFRDFWLSVNSEDEFDDGGEFSDLEELIMSSEEAENDRSAGKLMSGMANDLKTFLRVLNMLESPRVKFHRMPVSFPKYYYKKLTKHVNPNFSCRRNHHIYQPR